MIRQPKIPDSRCVCSFATVPSCVRSKYDSGDRCCATQSLRFWEVHGFRGWCALERSSRFPGRMPETFG